MEDDDICPNCGETDNLHSNLDWSLPHRPLIEILKAEVMKKVSHSLEITLQNLTSC